MFYATRGMLSFQAHCLGGQKSCGPIKLVQICLTSTYGSKLWDLYHDSVGKQFSDRNNQVNDSFNLPSVTHGYVAYNITNKNSELGSIFKNSLSSILG